MCRILQRPMTTWGGFAAAAPELAAFVEQRLRAAPSYLATVQASGAPRLHPVTPIFTTGGLYLFMEPTSPKGADLRQRALFALHNGVLDNAGSGGEASVYGTGHPVDDAAVRATVAAASSYDPAERYVLFELRLTEVRCKGYGDVALPSVRDGHPISRPSREAVPDPPAAGRPAMSWGARYEQKPKLAATIRGLITKYGPLSGTAGA